MSFSELIALQRAYFATGETKKIEKRRELLETLKRCVLENTDALADAVFKDLRRQQDITMHMEVLGAVKEIDVCLEHLEEWTAPKKVEHTDSLTEKDVPMLVKDPLGVVLLISPWNYPVGVNLWPLAAAIAAGNTVVVKPSEMAAHSTDLLAELFAKYFDKKVIAVVQGGIPETTELLKERFDHIMYTGAPPVGKIIMAAAAKHLTPVTLELGGKCPVVVADDADIETLAKKLTQTKWLNCGQTCIAPDYVLVSSKVKTKLVTELQKNINASFSENVQKSPAYSRLINQRHFDRLKALLERSTAEVLIKGGELDRDDVFIPPFVVDAKADDAVMEDEIFGPILPIITSESVDKSIEFINKGEKPLAAYVYSQDAKIVERLYNETSSGALVSNDIMAHGGVSTLPFGGVGNSGMGRYRGKFGFDTFTHEKAVLLRQL